MTKQNKFTIETHIEQGLTQSSVSEKIDKYGKNEISSKEPPGDLYFFFKQFQNPLVLVLVVAVIVTMVIGDFTDAAVIGLAVLINTALGFIQERKAFKSLESLKKVITHETTVIRDGEKKDIAVSGVVPGDVLVLYEGDKVPADSIIIDSTDVFIEEAILTGESVPVEKSPVSISESFGSIDELLSSSTLNLEKIEPEHKIFMGTIVTSGVATAIVMQTGMNTQFGGIAKDVEESRETKTPLEKKLDTLAKFITIGVIGLSIFIFVFGIATDRDPVEMFTTAVAIAVAAIPEGLVVGLTAILAIGMNKILKRKGLVRTLVAAETLGSVTTVCIDKTGTLTEGKMKVAKVESENEELLYKTSTLANDKKDPIEIARWQWAREYSKKNSSVHSPEELKSKNKRDGEIPFSVERRFLAVQVGSEIFLAGAPEEMLERTKTSSEKKDQYLELINEWAEQGKRLIGFAYIKEDSTEAATKTLEKLKDSVAKDKVQWLGIMAFTDPIRSDVQDILEKTKSAGITVKIITGDYRSTAISVLKQVGIDISPEQIMEGKEVEELSVKELQKKLKDVILFARSKPSHKLKIVNALLDNGEVVGMMGDGVNDAPALAKADIGIVVENATEVAKDSSELVLLDSNMQTIIAAIEEGRAMFDNLRKVTLYLLSDSFAELIIVLVSLISGAPLAITAAQILWINLIDDGLPNLALTVDPKAQDILKRKPLPKKTKLINAEMLSLILLISVIAAISCLVMFQIYLPTHGLEFARTMVFATLSVDSLLYVYSCRSLEHNIWQDPIWNNKYLVLATGVGLIFTFLSIHFGPFQTLLDTVPLSMQDWGVVFAVSTAVIIFIEVFKWLWNVVRK